MMIMQSLSRTLCYSLSFCFKQTVNWKKWNALNKLLKNSIQWVSFSELKSHWMVIWVTQIEFGNMSITDRIAATGFSPELHRWSRFLSGKLLKKFVVGLNQFSRAFWLNSNNSRVLSDGKLALPAGFRDSDSDSLDRHVFALPINLKAS